jgi:hypothetical protein
MEYPTAEIMKSESTDRDEDFNKGYELKSKSLLVSNNFHIDCLHLDSKSIKSPISSFHRVFVRAHQRNAVSSKGHSEGDERVFEHKTFLLSSNDGFVLEISIENPKEALSEPVGGFVPNPPKLSLRRDCLSSRRSRFESLKLTTL